MFVRRSLSILTLPLAAYVVASCIGCAQKPQVSPYANTYEQDVVHTVQYQGETLANIAKWYTGSSSNWHALLSANPALDPKRIRIGTTIIVPRSLANRSDAPPPPKPSSMAKKAPAPTPSNAQPTEDLSQDSYAAQQPPSNEVAADAPRTPDQWESAPLDQPDTNLAAENGATEATDNASADRASAELPSDSFPSEVPDSTSSAGLSPEDLDQQPPPPAASNGGLVKGILEAVGNAALDSKQGNSPQP